MEIRCFQKLSLRRLRDFVLAMRRIPLIAGQYLYKEGDQANYIYIIVEGDIIVTKQV